MTNAVSTPAYVRLPYWREVLDRAGRNAVQTLIPVLVAAQVGSVTGLDPINVLWVAAVAVMVTVLKALAGLQVDQSAGLTWRLADRALPAGAATMLSFLTVDGVDIATMVDWRAAGIASAAAALGAVAQAYVSPVRVTAELAGRRDVDELAGDGG